MGLFERLFGKKGRARRGERPLAKTEVFEGYYFSYQNVPNGYGGYHPVNLTFNHDEKGLHKAIALRSPHVSVTLPPLREKGWCPRGDSNSHRLVPTRT